MRLNLTWLFLRTSATIQLVSRPLQRFSPAVAFSTMSSLPHPPAPGPSQAGSVAGQGPATIHLYTAGTPNGYKASITLEELRAAYPDDAKTRLSYDVAYLSLWQNEQKHPDFLKINPNGRIPAIIDDNHKGHSVFESASVQLWLVENYDPDFKLWFKDPAERSHAISWLFWAQGGLGPMLGQAEFFIQFAPIKVPYGIKRYTDEGSRLFSVIEDGLAAGSNGWLVGGKFSIVDINVFAWARGHPWVDESRFPRVFKWLKDVAARDGVQKGLTVPKAPAQPTAEENAKAAKEVKEWVAQAEAELEALKARQ